jgi:hypothetical protein
VTDDDDLRINTLHRFAKHSPKLVLHEYSHCEVPAGCGGVVLRWIDPDQGRPVVVRVFGAKGEVWLEGAPLTSSLALLRTGVRVVAVHFERDQPGPRPFTVSLYHDRSLQEDLISGGTPTWRCTTAEPRTGWEQPGFDDRGWTEPTPAPDAVIAGEESWRRSTFERARERGQQVFVFAEAAIWLRVAFTMTEPSP